MRPRHEASENTPTAGLALIARPSFNEAEARGLGKPGILDQAGQWRLQLQ